MYFKDKGNEEFKDSKYFNKKINTNIDSELNESKFSRLLNNIDISKIIKIAEFILGIIIAILGIYFLANNLGKTTINLSGDYEMIILKNSDYVEPGYTAYDKKKKDITNEVKVTSDLNTKEVGTYTITYTVLGISKIRTVKVIEGGTTLYLKGNINMYLSVGQRYDEPGYTVYDSIEKDLTSKVKVSGSVDVNKPGTYIITYSVTTKNNITVTNKRTVIVVDKNSSNK